MDGSDHPCAPPNGAIATLTAGSGSDNDVARTDCYERLAERFGAPTPDGLRIGLPLSQDELAGWTGASREAVTKALRVLREEGLVHTGRLHVEDLVFGYSVPRCPKPLEVFDAMLRAMTYCQERLGGKIVGGDGRPPDLDDWSRYIREVTRELTSAGFPPGSENALRLF